jgi:hypothetical protein
MAARFALALAKIGGSSLRLPRWDEAKHGLDGVLLAEAIRGLDPLGFFGRLYAMAYWPPVAPLLELPVFLLFGYHYAVARCLMSAIFAATVFAGFLAGSSLGGLRGILVGLATAGFVCASPIYRLYGTVVMLELPGALFTFLAFAAYARYLDRRRLSDLRLACVAALALFFCKYNFGIMWIGAVALYELSRSSPWPVVRAFPERVARLSWGARAFLALLLLYGFLLAAILLSGGWTWNLAGQTITVRNLANPISILAVILLIRFSLRPRKNVAWIRGRWRALAQPHRTILKIVVLPILVWLLLPPHTAAFFNFVQNRSPDRGLMDNLLWYPRDFTRVYTPGRILGTLVFAIGLMPVCWIRRLPARDRLLTLGVTVGIAATTFHELKEARFFFVVAPLLWLSCSRTVLAAAHAVARGVRVERPAYAAAMLGLCLLAGLQTARLHLARTQEEFTGFTVPPEVAPLVDAITTESLSADGAVLLGFWDGLSPGLVGWQARIAHPGIEASRVATGPNKRLRLGSPDRFVDRLAESEYGEAVLVLDLHGSPPFAAAFREGSRWMTSVLPLLEADPRFHLDESRAFPDAGYTLRAFRRVSRAEVK